MMVLNKINQKEGEEKVKNKLKKYHSKNKWIKFNNKVIKMIKMKKAKRLNKIKRKIFKKELKIKNHKNSTQILIFRHKCKNHMKRCK